MDYITIKDNIEKNTYNGFFHRFVRDLVDMLKIFNLTSKQEKDMYRAFIGYIGTEELTGNFLFVLLNRAYGLGKILFHKNDPDSIVVWEDSLNKSRKDLALIFNGDCEPINGIVYNKCRTCGLCIYFYPCEKEKIIGSCIATGDTMTSEDIMGCDIWVDRTMWHSLEEFENELKKSRSTIISA